MLWQTVDPYRTQYGVTGRRACNPGNTSSSQGQIAGEKVREKPKKGEFSLENGLIFASNFWRDRSRFPSPISSQLLIMTIIQPCSSFNDLVVLKIMSVEINVSNSPGDSTGEDRGAPVYCYRFISLRGKSYPRPFWGNRWSIVSMSALLDPISNWSFGCGFLPFSTASVCTRKRSKSRADPPSIHPPTHIYSIVRVRKHNHSHITLYWHPFIAGDKTTNT